MDLGVVAEGRLEFDQTTGTFVVRCQIPQGAVVSVQDILTRYQGQDVRFVLTPSPAWEGQIETPFDLPFPLE